MKRKGNYFNVGQTIEWPASFNSTAHMYMKLLNQVKDLKFYIPDAIFLDEKKNGKA
jgi:hypothetical protein